MTLKERITATLVSLFLFPTVSFAAVLLDKIVAVVNKEVITWGELYKSMEFKAGDEFKSLNETEKRKIFKESEAEFLDLMIDTKLQVQAAKKLDIDVAKNEIEEAIQGIKKKYSMGDKEFEESLKKEGFTMQQYRNLLSEQIILSKVVIQQVKNKIVVSDKEVAEYAEKNIEPGYRIRQIFLRKPEKNDERNGIEVSAGEIYRKLEAGGDFAVLAAQYSNDPTGKTGGALGFVKKRHLGKEFLDTLSGMKVGDISKPFWTLNGLHIIKLEEKEEATNADEAKELAKKKLFDKRFNEEYRNWIKSLHEKSFIEVRL